MTDNDRGDRATVPSKDDEAGLAAAPDCSSPERREDPASDRRRVPRGGRRLSDRVAEFARFVHELLTEPPR